MCRATPGGYLKGLRAGAKLAPIVVQSAPRVSFVSCVMWRYTLQGRGAQITHTTHNRVAPQLNGRVRAVPMC